jgi:sec-independent protein translocase protein TatB
MFDIGWSELLVIAVVAIVVVGPKDLPRLMRTFGHYAGKLRRAAADFQRQFEEAMRDTEIEEVKKAIESVRDDTPSVDLKAPIDKPIMLPNPQGQPTQAQTNGKGGQQPTEAEPTASKKAAKPRKRSAKAKTPGPEGAEQTAAKPSRPRSRKPKAAEAKPAEPAKAKTAEAKAAEAKPAKAEPKP